MNGWNKMVKRFTEAFPDQFTMCASVWKAKVLSLSTLSFPLQSRASVGNHDTELFQKAIEETVKKSGEDGWGGEDFERA
ncbi:hypothetical protein J6590_047049 [Homalodisca vitripennis]|nr:hypothetical protein J6590_047049 [Homalodisca vitripennis]